MKEKKRLDLKSILTLISIISLVIFVGYILLVIKIDKEIGMLFFGVFIGLIQGITNYYFTRKSNDDKGSDKQ